MGKVTTELKTGDGERGGLCMVKTGGTSAMAVISIYPNNSRVSDLCHRCLCESSSNPTPWPTNSLVGEEVRSLFTSHDQLPTWQRISALKAS